MNCCSYAKLILLIFLIWPLCPAKSVFAAAARTSLFFIQNIQSDLTLDYSYDRLNSDKGQSKRVFQQHAFEETYGMSLDYAIYKHKYWSGTLGARFGFEQSWDDDTLAQTNSLQRSISEYKASGVLLKNSLSPLVLESYSTTEQVSRRFSRDYDLEKDRYSATLNIRSRGLPATLRYSFNELTTSGLDLDRLTRLKTLSLTVSHSYENISTTAYDIITAQDDQQFLGLGLDEQRITDSLTYKFWNRLNPPLWGRSLELKSIYRYRDETGYRQGKEWNWQEYLLWVPGRALRGEFFYRRDYQGWFDRERDFTETEAYLSHRLFYSVTTSVRGKSRNTEYNNGIEDEDSLAVAINYSKKLSPGRTFNISLEETRGFVDRNLDSDTISIFEESLTVSLVESNLLNNQNVIPGSIWIQSSDRLVAYVEGVDYLVGEFGAFTEIIIPAGSAIGVDDVLLINYQYMVNPSVDYSNDSHSLTTSLSMFDNQVTVYGRLLFAEQELRSGNDNLSTLENSDHYNLGIRGKLSRYVFGVDGQYTDKNESRTTGLSAYLLYSKQGVGSRFYSNFQYFYQNYKKDINVTTQRVSNRTGYSKKLLRKISLNTAGEYLYSFGQGFDRHEIDFLLGLQAKFGKTQFFFELNDGWTIYDDTVEHSDNLELKMVRNF